MKTIAKIALTFILVIGLSFPAYAEEVKNEAGEAITIDGSTSGADLPFTPSANTLLAYDIIDANSYTIASTSDKTNTTNGMLYGMTHSFNGYYQTQGDKTSLATADVTDWKAMGGTEAAAE